jgi:hypothetical protein
MSLEGGDGDATLERENGGYTNMRGYLVGCGLVLGAAGDYSVAKGGSADHLDIGLRERLRTQYRGGYLFWHQR